MDTDRDREIHRDRDVSSFTLTPSHPNLSPTMSTSPFPFRIVPYLPTPSLPRIDDSTSSPTNYTPHSTSICIHFNQSIYLFASQLFAERRSTLTVASHLALNRSPTCQHWFSNITHTHTLLIYHACRCSTIWYMYHTTIMPGATNRLNHW